MSVSNGRQFLSIPGPTNVPDVVLQAMMRPAVDIYTGPLVAMTDALLSDLKSIFRTKGQTYIYAANGHGGWEAALTNVLSRGDHVLALESGRFALGWAEMAKVMGAEVEVLRGEWHRAVDPAAVEVRLKADKAHSIKALLVVQIDTASGVVNDIPAIRRAMDAAKHPALLMVGLRGVARVHAVRDGRVGRRCRDDGFAEGLDDAAGLGVCRSQRACRCRA
jgi:alanine-glyoxylate transaminase / serine-glyoxylate transaminase / serine-pyruvate transaminase